MKLRLFDSHAFKNVQTPITISSNSIAANFKRGKNANKLVIAWVLLYLEIICEIFN